MTKKHTPVFKFSPDLLVVRRKLLSYSQAQIGEYIGVNKMTVSKWERGLSEPNDRYIIKLAKLFKEDPKRLMLLDFNRRAESLNVKSR